MKNGIFLLAQPSLRSLALTSQDMFHGWGRNLTDQDYPLLDMARFVRIVNDKTVTSASTNMFPLPGMEAQEFSNTDRAA